MPKPSRRPARCAHRTAVSTLLVPALLLTACGGGDGEDAADPATGTSASATQEPAEAADLSEGLLPEDAFAEGADVVQVGEEQLREFAATEQEQDVEITPEECAAAVEGTQPQVDEYEEIAGLSAVEGARTTIEVLLRGSATEGAVQQLADSVAACPQARISSPQLGEATLAFEALDAPELGDGSAVVRYTTTLTQDGTEVSVPALIGTVQDGDRVLTLFSLTADGSEIDEAAFVDLLVQAYEVQADALG